MVKRGLILPAEMVDVYLIPSIEYPGGDQDRRVAATVGTLWGIVPEVHVDFQITPFYMNAHSVPGTGRFAITGRFVKTPPIDVGAGVIAWFDTQSPNVISYIQPMFPVILRPSDQFRLDVAMQVPLYTDNDPHFGFRVPVSVYTQITDRIHIGSTTTLAIGDLRDPVATASIPIGLTGGYSAGPELGFAAFTPYITWTNFYTPASGAVNTQAFVAGVIADIATRLP